MTMAIQLRGAQTIPSTLHKNSQWGRCVKMFKTISLLMGPKWRENVRHLVISLWIMKWGPRMVLISDSLLQWKTYANNGLESDRLCPWVRYARQHSKQRQIEKSKRSRVKNRSALQTIFTKKQRIFQSQSTWRQTRSTSKLSETR